MPFLDVGPGDGATIGVGVDQQDLTAGGGRLEGEVDGDGGAARSALWRLFVMKRGRACSGR
jgi:hypothetical protein